jgi:hypothetical protein
MNLKYIYKYIYLFLGTGKRELAPKEDEENGFVGVLVPLFDDDGLFALFFDVVEFNVLVLN